MLYLVYSTLTNGSEIFCVDTTSSTRAWSSGTMYDQHLRMDSILGSKRGTYRTHQRLPCSAPGDMYIYVCKAWKSIHYICRYLTTHHSPLTIWTSGRPGLRYVV
jgi:hypothetical protein